MEGAILSPSNNRFRTHLKNAASAFCTRTLPKHRPSEPLTPGPCSNRHHTYPRATPPKRPALSCQTEPLASDHKKMIPVELAESVSLEAIQANIKKPNGVKLKGTLAREVANVWGCRVGPTEESAPADRVQNLFNDIELYPTKTQVFEMLVCARQCAGRKSLTLTFGEFCVFAAELRRCSRQARLTPNKTESPQWNVDKDLSLDSLCKHVNGSEVSPPPCEVFLGGSCNPTTWRSDIAIPMLKQMGITYFNPQVEDWSTELMEVEHRAKAEARALLFVLDSETRAVAASVEAAHLAAAPRDLLLVLKPYTRHQTIGTETLSDHEYVELSRARATLQEAVERRGLPAFSDIPAALRCARAVLRGARTQPRHSLGHTILRLKRAFDAAGGRGACLPRSKAAAALRDVTRAPRHVVDSYLPLALDAIDFEMFCAAVAELAADASAGWESRADRSVAARVCRAFRSLRDRLTTFVPVLSAESQSHNGAEAEAGAEAVAGARDVAENTPANGMRVSNARLRAYGRKLGLFIPKNGGSKPGEGESETGSGASSGDSLFTPGTERRLEKLPAMLGMPVKDVYLGGAFPSNQTRPEDVLSRERLTFVVPRANDYTRMFSAPARRAAPAHPESPRHDKKPRTECPHRELGEPGESSEPLIELRDRRSSLEPADRLSASDFYKVSEDTTPQPFKGTYDEDLLLGSRVLVFSMSADAPCFSAMVLAAHYMGLRPNATVLLVQTMDSKLCNSLYSEAAVKDYNRGRHYLIDLARRSGVPVFDNVDDTMACVLNRIRPT